ncbi:hypothetical protein V6N13_102203 [Hibiscus sabdariffa]|uniref:Transposase MuDR plant domain-containing protein n=1 Tax=Hibiscus sabdariffa TaxID=183260 RepID=A0ABR2D521_9ROSI
MEAETCFDFDFGTSSETNKGTKSVDMDDKFERQQDSDRDGESGRWTYYIDSSNVGSYESLDSTKQFKDALNKFVVAKRFDFKLVRNEKDKINAKCKGEGCP